MTRPVASTLLVAPSLACCFVAFLWNRLGWWGFFILTQPDRSIPKCFQESVSARSKLIERRISYAFVGRRKATNERPEPNQHGTGAPLQRGRAAHRLLERSRP